MRVTLLHTNDAGEQDEVGHFLLTNGQASYIASAIAPDWIKNEAVTILKEGYVNRFTGEIFKKESGEAFLASLCYYFNSPYLRATTPQP